MKKAQIDVIIPTYNGLPWLESTVDSVLSQTFKDFTLYIVDDGSTDGTKKYVDSLKDKRIVYLKKKNGGQSTARNMGLDNSDSPFVAFLDADDIWYPEKLEKQMKVLSENPKVGLVYGHHYLLDENDIITGSLKHEIRGQVFDELCHGNFISGSASMVLIRRSVIDLVGKFREDFLIGEDWDMWLRIAKVSEIDFVPGIVAALRQRSDGMQTNIKKMADGLVFMFDEFKKTLSPTRSQKDALAYYCFMTAGSGYLNLGQRAEARKLFFKMFRESPRSILRLSHWKIKIVPSFFMRMLLDNFVFEFMRRVIRKLGGITRQVIFKSFSSLKGVRMSKVDVIIPTYNGLPWLEKTIQSVMDQTFQDFKLYVVDDGSTDGTKKYVDSINDKRITYIKKKNGGQSTARNLGIQKSTSEFIALLDADDVWYPEKLEKQLKIMDAKPEVGMVYGHHHVIDEEDIILDLLRHSNRGDLFDVLCHGNFISGSASMVLIRRSILEEVGEFREDYLIGEDWEMWLRIAKVTQIDYVPEVIAALRQRGDGMQQNYRKMADGLVYMFDEMSKNLGLTKLQRVFVGSYCLTSAADAYYMLGERGLARNCAIRLLKLNPRAAIDLNSWEFYIAAGIYSKVFIGNPVFDLIYALYRTIIDALDKLLKVAFDSLKFVARGFKKA